jgi:hypothetical protein
MLPQRLPHITSYYLRYLGRMMSFMLGTKRGAKFMFGKSDTTEQLQALSGRELQKKKKGKPSKEERQQRREMKQRAKVRIYSDFSFKK